MKRMLIIGGLIFVVVIAILIYGVFTSLDSIVEAAIEQYGSEVTQTPVTIDEVKISLTDGEGTIRGLRVGNPKGFTTDHAFQLGEIQLALDVGTITGDPVVVKEILINKPAVTYEFGPDGSNIDAIQENVQSYIGPGESSQGDSSEGPKLVIEKLAIKGGEINVKTTVLTEQELSTGLPDIHLKNIGKAKGGTSPGEVAKQIVAQLTTGVGSAVATLNLDKLGGVAEEAATRTKEVLEGGIEEASGAVKGTSDKLKKLLD